MKWLRDKLQSSDNPIEIINYAPEFQADFDRLNRAWLTKYFEVEPIDHQVLTDPTTYITEPGGYIFLARCDDKIVGAIALIKCEDTYELSKMAVDEKYQGRGIGHALMEACIEKARTLNVDSIYLLTNSKLKTAFHLYDKFGFKSVPPSMEDKEHYARCDTRYVLFF